MFKSLFNRKSHEKKVAKLHTKSEKTVQTFIDTEQKLNRHNTELADTVIEINEQILYLEELKEAAIQRKVQNDGVIQRVGQILRG